MPGFLRGICGGLLCLAFPTIAAATTLDAIDDYVRVEMDRRHIPAFHWRSSETVHWSNSDTTEWPMLN
jgi:hypothetical protein